MGLRAPNHLSNFLDSWWKNHNFKLLLSIGEFLGKSANVTSQRKHVYTRDIETLVAVHFIDTGLRGTPVFTEMQDWKKTGFQNYMKYVLHVSSN